MAGSAARRLAKKGWVLMPTIVVTSDLHLGITGKYQLQALVEDITAIHPDLTILAGDIGEGLPKFVACLGLFSGVPGMVGVLAGNHDIWARYGYASKDLWECRLPEEVRSAGMLWLEDMVWRLDGLAVVGSLAWYDYSAAVRRGQSPEFYAANKARYNADGLYINWQWEDAEFARRLGDQLVARLDQIESEATVRSCLVATHVPLVEEQISRRPWDRRWSVGNAYFGNLTLGRRVLQYRKVEAIISGHTHVGRQGRTARPYFPDMAPVSVAVVPSDYNKPSFVTVELDPS
jgi:3',5'-cyclic AMP phosphodiesterase CpdA